MNRFLTVLVCLHLTLALSATQLKAGLVDSIDFEGGNDGTTATFSQNNLAVFSVDQDAQGSNGSEVVEFEITSLSGNPSFAGGIVGGLDLGPKVTAGNITQMELDQFTFSFDIEATGGAPGLLRIEPLGGGFGQRAELNVSAAANVGFQTFSIPLSSIDTSGLLSGLNQQSLTEIQFVFASNDNEQVGDTVSLDNLTLTAEHNSVPEPSSTCLVLAVIATTTLRRRRCVLVA